MKNNLTEWVNLAAYSVTLLLFITGTALALWRIHREKKGAQAEELARYDQARGTLESLLHGSVLRLVTAAEREYGAGMGAVKKSAFSSGEWGAWSLAIQSKTSLQSALVISRTSSNSRKGGFIR